MTTKHLVFITFLVFLGCEDTSPVEQIKVKNCISECVEYEFRNFHNGQFLGSSSSLNGLGQQQIYDSVYSRCEKFYADEKCCQTYGNYTSRRINTIHDMFIGACK